MGDRQSQFHRGGTIELKGAVNLANANPDVDVDIVFDKYRTLRVQTADCSSPARPKSSTIRKRHIAQRHAQHRLRQVWFAKSSMPTLDDDVVVLGETPKEATATTPINMNLVLNINDNVRFVGYGADVTIGGKLTLTSRPAKPSKASVPFALSKAAKSLRPRPRNHQRRGFLRRPTDRSEPQHPCRTPSLPGRCRCRSSRQP